MASVVNGGRKITINNNNHNARASPSPASSSMIPRSTSPTKSVAGSSLGTPRVTAKLSPHATAVSRLTPSISTSNLSGRARATTSATTTPVSRRAPSPLRRVPGNVSVPSSPPNAPDMAVGSLPTRPLIKARITVRKPSGDYSADGPLSPSTRPPVTHERRRSDSLRIHHAPSMSSLSAIRTPVGRTMPLPDSGPPSPVGSTMSVKVKAKVSGSARKAALTATPSPLASPSLPLAELRPGPSNLSSSTSLRVRAPSTVSKTGLPYEAPPPIAHSLSLPAPPAATPGPSPTSRFATPHFNTALQSSPHERSSSPRPPPFKPSPNKTASVIGTTARVDPAAVPLPPTSPPGSALSYSSHSSVSSWTQFSGPMSDGASAVGTSTAASTPPIALRPHGRRSIPTTHPLSLPHTPNTPTPTPNTLKASGSGSGSGAAGMLMSMVDMATPPRPSTNGNDEDEEDQSGSDLGSGLGANNDGRAKAKSNRKIADLEITNRSLLAINGTLETAKHKQAREIRELRRRLRESRLAMPPRMFRLMRSQELEADASMNDEDPEDDDEEENSDQEGDGGPPDESYLRVRALLEGLISTAKTALEETPESLLGRDAGRGLGGGAKVLSAEEVKSWHRDSPDDGDADGGPSPRTELGDLSIISEDPSSLFGDGHADEDGDDADDIDTETSVAHSEDEVEVEKSLLLDLGPDGPSPAFGVGARIGIGSSLGSGIGIGPRLDALRFQPRSMSPSPPIVVSSPR